jgi:hypothetical protein
MAGEAFRALRLLYLSMACLVTASCGSSETPPPEPVHLPEQDRLYFGLNDQEAATATNAVKQALETRASEQSLSWQSETGAAGTITPLRTFKITTGHFCRDYREAVSRSNVSVSAVRRACRTTNGDWLRVPLEEPAQSGLV